MIYFPQTKTKFKKKLKVAMKSSFSFEACCIEPNDANPLKCSPRTCLEKYLKFCYQQTFVD